MPRISDHNMALTVFNVGVPDSLPVRRLVYDFSKASRAELRAEFQNVDWSCMDTLDVDAADRFLHETVFVALNHHIPRREVLEHKSAHMWVNQRCLDASAEKNSSVGTADFTEKAAACSAVLLNEYFLHIQRMRVKLPSEKRGSKR